MCVCEALVSPGKFCVVLAREPDFAHMSCQNNTDRHSAVFACDRQSAVFACTERVYHERERGGSKQRVYRKKCTLRVGVYLERMPKNTEPKPPSMQALLAISTATLEVDVPPPP